MEKVYPDIVDGCCYIGSEMASGLVDTEQWFHSRANAADNKDNNNNNSSSHSHSTAKKTTTIHIATGRDLVNVLADVNVLSGKKLNFGCVCLDYATFVSTSIISILL